MNKKENLYDRLLCFLCILSITSAFIFCAISPIHASADTVDDPVFWAQQTNNYKEQLEQGLQETENALITDIKNGNIDATSALAKQRMQAYALQQLALTSPALYDIYHYADLAIQGIPTDYFDNPSEISISGSGMGAYYYNSSGNLNVSFLYLTDWTSSTGEHILVNAPDFTFKFISTGEDTAEYKFYQNGTNYPFIFSAIYTGDLTLICDYPDNTYTDYSQLYTSPVSVSETFHVYSNEIPTIAYFGNRPFRDAVIGGLGETVVMPVANVESDRPYDYYNNTLLPYIRQNLPSVTDVDIVFPNGWHPADPVEPSTMPNGGMSVNNNWNFNIGFNTIVVTDASGVPVTDASGETVTETVIETETRPTDAVYHFQIPTLTPLETQVATIPPYEVPAEYAGYMGNMFTAITDFIDDAGLTDIAPVFLALAGIGLVIGVLL